MKTAILFILMLLVLIIPHEWGHMIVAKKCGVRVFEFSVGMGPLIFKWEKGGTQYSIRLLPLGGFCRMEGEEEAVDSPTSYSNQPNGKKVAILLAGVTMNIIIAVLAVTISICITGVVTNSIGDVNPGSPAAVAGLQSGDKIVEINGTQTKSWEEVSEGIRSYDGKGSLDFTIERDGKEVSAEVTPEYNEEAGSYMIGITAGVSKNVWECARLGPKTTWELNKAMLQGFKMLFTGGLSADDVAGPVGLVKVVDQAASYGIAPYLMLLALVSLNLAIFNVIPIPGLDGGKVFFIILKIISRGKIDDEMENKATLIGMALILALFILITFNDVKNLFG